MWQMEETVRAAHRWMISPKPDKPNTKIHIVITRNQKTEDRTGIKTERKPNKTKNNTTTSAKGTISSRHASKTNTGIYKTAVYSMFGPKKPQWQQTTRIYKVYIWRRESTWEGGVPIYGRTVTGRRDTLTGRKGSPSRAANQWEQEREEDSMNGGRGGSELLRARWLILWACDAVGLICQQVQHSLIQLAMVGFTKLGRSAF